MKALLARARRPWARCPQMRLPATLLVLVGLLFSTACGPGQDLGETAARGAWQRTDLSRLAPAVDATPFLNPQKPTFEQRFGYLGAREVRDLRWVPPESLAVHPYQSAGQVREVRQVVGSTLAWTVALGADPFLTFVPLPDQNLPCATTLRVGVRTPEVAAELFQSRIEARDFEGIRLEDYQLAPPSPLAPSAVRVDLGDWAGTAQAPREVELLFVADIPPVAPGTEKPPRGSCWVRWATPAVWSRGPALPPPSESVRPNLILLGLDTLRADHVGAFRKAALTRWSPPSLTPTLDRLAADSDVYLNAHATFNATNPSFASILTGLYGKNHGVYDLRTPLPPAHTTLAEILRDAGYNTLAVISAHHLGDHNSGLGQGFDEVILVPEHGAAEWVVGEAAEWISRQSGPFFVWLHLFDPHTPHTPPQPFALGMRPAVPPGLGPEVGWTAFRPPSVVAFDQPILAGHRDLYAGEVAYLDHQLDRFLAYLDSRHLLATSVLAVVADHGEELGEHGMLYRHIGLWDTTTHVPMLVRRPGPWSSSARSFGSGLGSDTAAPRGRRHPGLVQTLDLFPTLLEALGIEPPNGIAATDGIDLTALMSTPEAGRRAVFTEHAGQLGLSVRTPQYRLYRSAGSPHIPDGNLLYDLTTDPKETQNLAGQGLAVEEQLAELLRRWAADRRPTPEAQSRELSPEEIRKLKALGYL